MADGGPPLHEPARGPRRRLRALEPPRRRYASTPPDRGGAALPARSPRAATAGARLPPTGEGRRPARRCRGARPHGAARAASVTPVPHPAPGACATGSGRRAARSARAAQVLRVQVHVPPRPLLLRRHVRSVRRTQLGEAASDRRPHRTRGARHRRARQDRLPGVDHAAARGRARDRDHALPSRRRPALRRRARLRHVGRPPRGVRRRPPAHAQRRGLLSRSHRPATTGSTSS